MSSNKHFFILKDPVKSDIGHDNDQLHIVTFPNPATGKPTKFLLRNNGQDLYELNCFSELNRSWFINETVCSNGKIYLPTRVDPLFLVIPYLAKNCTGKAVPLEHILVDVEFPHMEQLAGTVAKGDQLTLIADEKKAGDILAYKYNEEKTLNWLKRKCARLEQALGKERKFARSHNFIKEEKENERQDGEMLHYAHGIISDYLSLDLSKKLGVVVGLPEPEKATQNKRKSTAEIEINQIKKIKKEETRETTPIKSATAEKRVSAKSKALAKAATGTKSISSFFKK